MPGRGVLRLIADPAAVLAAVHARVLVSADVRTVRTDHARPGRARDHRARVAEPLGRSDPDQLSVRRARDRARAGGDAGPPRGGRADARRRRVRRLSDDHACRSRGRRSPALRCSSRSTCLADFANPLIVGGDFPLLATEAWYRIDGWGDVRGRDAARLARSCRRRCSCSSLERYWVSRRSYTVISGRGSTLERTPLPRVLRWALVGFCAPPATVILSLYFGVIVGAFTETWGVDWTPTLRQMAGRAGRKADHVGHSVMYAAISPALSPTRAGHRSPPTSSISARCRPAESSISSACCRRRCPGVFLGIGYLLAFNRPGIPLAGTAAVLVIAFTFANLPFSYQVIRAGLAQIDRNLADAAADLGASRFRVLWDVHLRLVFPVCVSAWTTTFVSCVTNLSIAIFLVTPGSPGSDVLDPRPDRRQPPRGRVGPHHRAACRDARGGRRRLARVSGRSDRSRGRRCMTRTSSSSASASGSDRWRPSPTSPLAVPEGQVTTLARARAGAARPRCFA